MKNLNLFSKILLYITSLSGILWFGSYISRLILFYQLFSGPKFNVSRYISASNLPGILYTLNDILLLAAICFFVFIISFVMFLIFSKVNLKKNGWLFISAIIVFITLPFETYLTYIDYKIFNLVNSVAYNPFEVLNLYLKRLNLLGSFSLIEILCYASIIFLVLFQPLKKSEPKL